MNKKDRNCLLALITIAIFMIFPLFGCSSSLIQNDYYRNDKFNIHFSQQIKSEEILGTRSGSLVKPEYSNRLIVKTSDMLEDLSSSLIIEDISSNFNKIILSIRNNGVQNITNISINVNSIGGILIKTSGSLLIPKLQTGESLNQELLVFGLGIGVFLKYAKVLFNISSLDIGSIYARATVKILGPFVKIISTSYDIDANSEGFTLLAPMWDSNTYLIDNSGDIVHSWNSLHLETQAAYLLENGNLIRTSIVPFSPIFSGGSQGFIEIFDWFGNRIWKYKYASDEYCQHHDVEVLPNGNILLISWEIKTPEEAIAEGKNPNDIYGNQLWSDYIVEIEPVGQSDANVVWEWHAWDHLIQDFDSSKNNFGIVSDHPELIDINFGNDWRDWLHVNAIDYSEEYDQILISVFNFNEIWIIDHNTTTEEASGHYSGSYGGGGDLLYRWGNPQAYDHGDESDQKYYGQHGANWVEPGCPGEGNILVFNNGNGRPEGRYSSVDEIVPPVDDMGNYYYSPKNAYGPDEQVWIFTYKNPKEMQSSICSNAQRLLNGNTLICSATQGTIYEVTPEKEIIWSYFNYNPLWYYIKTVPEALRYSPDYPGLNNLY